MAIVTIVAHCDGNSNGGARTERTPESPGRWIAWYFTRLPRGLVYGSVAVLIVVLFLGTLATTPKGNLDTSAAAQATGITVDPPGVFSGSTSAIADVAGGRDRCIAITFAPDRQLDHKATLTVASPQGTVAGQFTLTGTGT